MIYVKEKAALFFILTCLHFSTTVAQGFKEILAQVGASSYCIDPHQMGGGIIVLDYNDDNFQDILILGGESENVLLRNNWGGSYSDVTRAAGVLLSHVETVGGVAGDIDNDGDLDLFITTSKDQPNVLLRNNGDDTFTDISEAAGIIEESWSTSATMGDYNLDGLLDIYVSNYVQFQSLPFDKLINECYPNFLYQNMGNQTFKNVAPDLGVDNTGCGLATTFTDFDNDSDLDLLVINDFGLSIQPNEIYLNNYPAPSFTPAAAELNADARINGMGVAIGDYDEDLDLDYYLTNIAENILLENDQASTIFNNVANQKAVGNADGTSWGAVFSDINNDSYLDLIIANGQVIQADHQNNENRLFLGSQDGYFQDVSVAYGIANGIRSRGLLVSDLNNDGLNDLLFASVSKFKEEDYRTAIYQNLGITSGNWIKIKLEGSPSTRDGYGSRITVNGRSRSLVREVDGGSSYLSHASAITHFGLGDIDTMTSISVQWPGGNIIELNDIPVNSYVTIREDGSWYLNQNREVSAYIDEAITVGEQSADAEGINRHYELSDAGHQVRIVTRLSLKERPPSVNEKSIVKLMENPSLGNIHLQYSLPHQSKVSIRVYDSSGTLAKASVGRDHEAGDYHFDIADSRLHLSAGVYTIQVIIGEDIFILRAIVL